MTIRKLGRRLSRPRGLKGWREALREAAEALLDPATAAAPATPAMPAACSNLRRLRPEFSVFSLTVNLP